MNKTHFKFGGIALALAAFVSFHQACSDVTFSQSERSVASDPVGPANGNDDYFDDVAGGLQGGHFDLDTSSQYYPLNSGQTDHHVHEYDDKYNVTYADYFALKDPKFKNITDTVAPSARFVLVIANAQLSPKALLSINGVTISVQSYQEKVKRFMAGDASALVAYSLDGSSNSKLSSLRIGFSPDALVSGGLIGTETSCVVKNQPGRLGEYRNGALTIQAVDSSKVRLDPALGVATADGGLHLRHSSLLWSNDLRKGTGTLVAFQHSGQLASAGSTTGANTCCGAIKDFFHRVSAVTDGLFYDVPGNAIAKANDLGCGLFTHD